MVSHRRFHRRRYVVLADTFNVYRLTSSDKYFMYLQNEKSSTMYVAKTYISKFLDNLDLGTGQPKVLTGFEPI